MTIKGEHPLRAILSESREKKMQIVPVTGLERDAQHQTAVKEASAVDKLGICLRLVISDLNSLRLSNDVMALLSVLDIVPEQVDLIVDLGEMHPSMEATYELLLPTQLNSLPHLLKWRSLSISGCSFPSDLRDISTGTTQAICRTEWHVWKAIIGRGMQRRPTFSDYAISHPEYVSLDFRFVKRTANIRYTHFDDWLVVRGKLITKGQANQYPGLARILRAMPEYMGRDFSWGDRYIDDCANGADGPGSATTWRQVGTNHHLTFAVKQIASHLGV